MPQKVLFAFIILFFVWILITGFSREEIILGLVVSALVAMVSGRELIKGPIITKFHPKRWVLFFIYIIVFVIAEIYSHFDLAIRIVVGDVDPGILHLKSKTKNPLALTVLGNSITLTPGTLTLDVRGKDVTAYCVDTQSKTMIKIFETFLEDIFK